jgi:hypothetical protein
METMVKSGIVAPCLADDPHGKYFPNNREVAGNLEEVKIGGIASGQDAALTRKHGPEIIGAVSTPRRTEIGEQTLSARIEPESFSYHFSSSPS